MSKRRIDEDYDEEYEEEDIDDDDKDDEDKDEYENEDKEGEDEYDEEEYDEEDIKNDPSGKRKGSPHTKNVRVPFLWTDRQFLKGDLKEVKKWIPWDKSWTSTIGVETFKTKFNPRLLIKITKSAYHPVKEELSEYNPDMVIGIWSQDLKNYISFIIPVMTIHRKSQWDEPIERWGFQTYKKILNSKESGLLQHYFPIPEDPRGVDIVQMLRQEIEDLGSNAHF